MFITFLLIYMLLGAVVGFLSGLLGIGGGLVIVPVFLIFLMLSTKNLKRFMVGVFSVLLLVHIYI